MLPDLYNMGEGWQICVCCKTQEVASGNTSQKSDEEDFVKVEGLPMQLSVMCEVCVV